ncbi:hypothetical protein [Haloprofundus salinisoli]|nr:hypothetical protein [Haloprofundus salinisoli]
MNEQYRRHGLPQPTPRFSPEEVRYESHLSRQRGGERDGCWLTDDIVPME